MNVRMLQICLWCTDSDNAICERRRQFKSQNFLLLLDSLPVGLGILFDYLTSGAEHPADTLADAGDFTFDFVEVPPLLR